ncbi:putative helicase [Serratia phage vB_SmaS-Totoro]|nr:putative helicase [Serratia phage vB_SmaS-Totoro]
MNYRLLIVNALMLMYWETQASAGSDSKSLVKRVLKDVKVEKGVSDTEQTIEIFNSLKTLILKMTANPSLAQSKELISQNVRILAAEEPSIIDMIEQGLHAKMDEEAIKRHCRTLIMDLNEFARKAEFKVKLADYSKKILYGDGEFELNEIARAMVNHFEYYAMEKNDSPQNAPGVMDFVDFTNVESVKAMFEKAKKQVSKEEIIKFGLQGLNRMFGEQGGGRRGEAVLVGGLQHHFKSGLTMMMTKGAALYNKPKLQDPNKKPAIVLISSENDLPINIRTMYKQCIEPTLGRPIALKDINPNDAAQYMHDKFAENGWHFLMFRINPDEFTFDSLQSLFLGLEADGYEIIVCTFDYLAMMSTKGFDNGGITGRDKQALFKRTRNFMVLHNVLFITPHQLSTEALAIERDRPNQFLNEILNRAYYNECKTIAQEVDMEINIQKQIVDGVAYLNLGRGKHRGVDNTPLDHQRCTYRFTDIGIPDDIDGEDLSMKKPGAQTASEGGGAGWHQSFEDINDFQQH